MQYKNPKSITAEYGIIQQNNIKQYVKIQEALYQEYCQLYSISVEYFSRNLNYFNSDGSLNKDLNSDFTFFNGPETRPFSLVIPMKGLLSYGSDAFMFNDFGIETTTDGTFYITKKQFYFDCLQYGGKYSNPITKTIKFTQPVKYKKIRKFEKTITVNADDDPENKTFDLTVKFDDIKIESNDFTIGNIFNNIVAITRPVIIPDSVLGTVYSTYYETNNFIGINHNEIPCHITVDENKIATFEFDINITYNWYDLNNNAHWNTFDQLDETTGLPTGVRIPYEPKVGDFIRVKMVNDPTDFRDYYITNVADTNFSSDKFSPFLSKFIWECSITMRPPSLEHIADGKPQQAPGIETEEQFNEEFNLQSNTNEKFVYDYQNTKELLSQVKDDKTGTEKTYIEPLDYEKDNVYGGYGSGENDNECIDLDEIYGG